MFQVKSCSHYGIEAYKVMVEVDRGRGLPQLITVGLPDTSVKESRERVRAAIKNSGFEVPPRKLTINLAPADRKKEGPSFDLPIALGILAASEAISPEGLSDYFFIAELALDGKLRPVKGDIVLTSSFPGSKFIVAKEGSGRLSFLGGSEVYPAKNLKEVVHFLEGKIKLSPLSKKSICSEKPESFEDFSDVRGLRLAKRAIEISASGAHNLLMVGPPGSGKTMLAKRIPGILPPLSDQEALEVLKIESLNGIDHQNNRLVRPFRSPHHGASAVALTGGGSLPKPGEISLAHHGVLFLDELSEFRRDALEALRAPLEDGIVSISRSGGRLSFPSRFMLAAAMNPCPCGFLNDPKKPCRCSLLQIQKYRSKISGPIFDRIDIHLEVPSPSYQHLTGNAESESSEIIRERVMRSRALQLKRNGGKPNAFLSAREVKRYATPEKEGMRLLEEAMKKLHFSARSFYKILKVSRTIADLEGLNQVGSAHVSEALSYRFLDRAY